MGSFLFFFITTTTTTRNENQEKLWKNVAKKRRLAAGQRSSHTTDHVLASVLPMYSHHEENQQRERLAREERREIGPGITYVSCRGGEGNNMGSGIRNTAEEDAPIEIERDGGGIPFLLSTTTRHARLPQNQIPLLYVCVVTRMSHNISPKNPHSFFYLFIL